MNFESVMKEGIVSGPAYQLAAQGIKDFGNKNPNEIVKKMIEKSKNPHRKERIKKLENEIKYAIKFMRDER